ncbi:MAG: hypothetical protein H0X39_13920 [Actinobacteria bacterium]|nr:hypothetical protein [Actinomycetota bacterium]
MNSSSLVEHRCSRTHGFGKTLDDLFWEMIQWRPAPDSHYFEVRAERAAFHRYGVEEIALRWSAE